MRLKNELKDPGEIHENAHIFVSVIFVIGKLEAREIPIPDEEEREHSDCQRKIKEISGFASLSNFSISAYSAPSIR